MYAAADQMTGKSHLVGCTHIIKVRLAAWGIRPLGHRPNVRLAGGIQCLPDVPRCSLLLM